VTRWFKQKSAQYLSKNTQFGAQSKNTKKGEKLLILTNLKIYTFINEIFKFLKLFGKNFEFLKIILQKF